jgi:pimeloyl-ACP methyl ester carboxylesterase
MTCLREGTVTLSAGRRLGFAEYGVRGGRPILHFHGAPGGRFYDLDRAALVHAGAWLLTLERPGIGLSDAQPGRTLLDWPVDVAEFADHFDLKRFAVLGTSAGAPYALACGHALGARIAAVGLQCPSLGFPDDPSLDSLNPFSADIKLYRDDPAAFRAEVMEHGKKRAAEWAGNPDALFDDFDEQLPENDRPFFAAGREQWMRILAATYGTEPPVDEHEIVVRPWGFSPADIKVPVHAWIGAEDQLASLSLLQLCLSRIPDSGLTVYPGEGHFIAPAHHADFLRFLTSRF